MYVHVCMCRIHRLDLHLLGSSWAVGISKTLLTSLFSEVMPLKARNILREFFLHTLLGAWAHSAGHLCSPFLLGEVQNGEVQKYLSHTTNC